MTYRGMVKIYENASNWWNGFSRTKLAFRLKNMGYEVTATGRNKTIGKVLEQNGIEFVHCPLEDRERVLQVCKDKDYIFHSGALSSLGANMKIFIMQMC